MTFEGMIMNWKNLSVILWKQKVLIFYPFPLGFMKTWCKKNLWHLIWLDPCYEILQLISLFLCLAIGEEHDWNFLWPIGRSFVYHISISQTIVSLVLLLVLLESPRRIGVHQDGFVIFKPLVQILNKFVQKKIRTKIFQKMGLVFGTVGKLLHK